MSMAILLARVTPSGVRSFIPTMHAEVYVLPTGYDSNFWSNPHSIIHNKNSVLSVAFVSNEKVFRLKGFDLLLAAAKLLPDFEFTLVGLSGKMLEYVKNNSGKNVKVEPPIKNNELPAFFSRHHIYAQLSESEGLPNSLCEAMLCECIPVGSDVNGIPTGIGDTGFILKKRDAHMAAELFQKASEAGEDLGKKARNRIIAKFSNEQREYKLLRLIDNS
jgi:glycosyltransferase involved in cell wall biosynthesis